MSNHGEPKYVSGDYPPEQIRRPVQNMALTCNCKDGQIIKRFDIPQCDVCGKPAEYLPEDQPTPADCIRSLIERYQAENVHPNSYLSGKIAGLREALEIVTNGGD